MLHFENKQMDQLLMQANNLLFEKRNKFVNQKIRKQYIERHGIRRKKSKNYNKHKIRKNSFIRQSLKKHIKDDFENYYYNYSLSQCSCDFDSNDNDSLICAQCLAKGISTQRSNIPVKTETEMSKISQNNTLNQVREQKFQEYFGYNYLLSKSKPSKLNLGKNIKNYTEKDKNSDRLHLLLNAIFRESFYNIQDHYPTFLFLPIDICNVISNYIFGKTILSHRSKRAIAGIHWFANTINDFMNDRTNQCELEDNYLNINNKKNKNSTSQERCRFNILKFMYVGKNTLTDILLSRWSPYVDKIDIVLDMYQLTRHFEQHLKLYHSNHRSVMKPVFRWDMPNFDHRWQRNVNYHINHDNNINCRCIFWQYYYNNGKVTSDIDFNIPPRGTFQFKKYVCKHRYCLNIGFLATIFDDILKRLKKRGKGIKKVSDEGWSFNKTSLECSKRYIYNGFNLKHLKFKFYNSVEISDYNSKCRDTANIKKRITNYCNFENVQYYIRRSGNLKRKDVEIDVPLYPFKLQPHLYHFDYFSMINPMLIDLNSFVTNINDNSTDIKYNLKTLVKNWNCNYNDAIYQMNKRGLIYLLDIERRLITAPKNSNDLINERTFHVYFWKLVQFCEKLMNKNEFHFWNIDNKYLQLIKKYCHHSNTHFWDQHFVSKFLTSGIKKYYEYYSQLIRYRNRKVRNRNGNSNSKAKKRAWARARKRTFDCCYYKMKMDMYNENNNPKNNNNDSEKNVYLVRFKIFEYLGFDKMLKLKIANDKSFSNNFYRMINDSNVIKSLPIKIELNYCLIQFDYLNYIKDDLQQFSVSSSNLHRSGYDDIPDCGYKLRFKIDDIVKYCQKRHKDHVPLVKKQRQKRRKEQRKQRLEYNLAKQKKETDRQLIEFYSWYIQVEFRELNEYLVDDNYLTRKGDKKFNDIHWKRKNFRKKKTKKHKLFQSTKKISKKRSKHQRIMDKKNNKKSKREKYQKQNLMSLQLEYTMYPFV